MPPHLSIGVYVAKAFVMHPLQRLTVSLVEDVTKLSFVASLDSGASCWPARSPQWGVRIATRGVS